MVEIGVKDQFIHDRFAIYNGDSTEVLQGTPDNSIHFSVTSIPFASLYTYSNSERDLGNSKNYEEFKKHFEFLVKEWVRVMMPGRLISIHCMNLPTSKERDGRIGLRDFRGDIIRLLEGCGMVYHSEVVIWKDPVIAMQRTKALGLLHKQIKKDSGRCRQGIPDYLVTFRKPGDNPEPITHTNETFPVSMWQEYASPIWTDINPSDTLQYRSVREDKDERHICPLQLTVIRRAIELWSNPDDVVLDPFDGIGSVGYVALEEGRRHLGIELKDSYYKQAVANCKVVIDRPEQIMLSEIFIKQEAPNAKPLKKRTPTGTSGNDLADSADSGNYSDRDSGRSYWEEDVVNDSEKTVKSFIKVYEDGTQEMSERGILITEFHDNENEEVKVTFDVSGFSMTDFLRLIYGVFVQFAKQGAFDALIGSQDEEDSTW